MSDASIDRLIANRRSWWPALDPKVAAVLVIDMQEYQVREDWPLHRFRNKLNPGLRDYFLQRVAEVVEPNIVRVVAAARDAGVPVVFTKFSSHDAQGRDLPRHFRQYNAIATKAMGAPIFPHQGDPASAIVPSLAPRQGDIVITKTTSGVFTGTELERLLKNMNLEQLIVCGVLTNACVESSARAGSDLGFYVTIVDDACAAWSESAHAASLRSFEMCFGAVATTDAVIRQLNPKLA
jgi:nicotinamidase-related amidase